MVSEYGVCELSNSITSLLFCGILAASRTLPNRLYAK
jgi:hypothetical protein